MAVPSLSRQLGYVRGLLVPLDRLHARHNHAPEQRSALFNGRNGESGQNGGRCRR
jgi:hypothetical protein